MIGDPSGKSDERNLLDKKILKYNEKKLKLQFEKFLDFKSKKNNRAILVNNYDWMSKFSIIDFSRDIGKHITVNYMMAKESVKKRISKETTQGMSFTEFTYQLIQGYDFLHLYKEMNCMLQMGGSDQWGNITTGTELIRRKENKKAYAMTCPLIKKSDGSKFGKSEGGNVWLDKNKTSVYKFYQYWLNISDEDALSYIKVFTFLSKSQVEELILEQYIGGQEIQVAVINGKALGAIELIPKRAFYDYKAKYTKAAKTKHIMPARLKKKKYLEVLRIAKKAHQVLGCKGVTRSDFKFYNNKFYLLEINTQPGMTNLSLVPEIANHYGITFPNLVENILMDASTNR